MLSGTFTGTVNVGSTIIQQVAPAAGPAAPRPSIFLSYAHRDDKPFVLRLHKDLLALGFDAWRDETDLGSDGPDLTDAVRGEIERCVRFVPVIGPAAFERPVVQAEWNHARLCCKPFTPIWRLGERPQPDGFEDKLYVDFRDDATYAAKLDALARLLGRTPDSPGPLLTRVPELPPGVIPRRELAQLRRLRQPLAAGATTVAITGRAATHAVQAPGGLGKSVLAAIFARQCATLWAFGDGVVWLEVGKTPSIPALQAELGRLFGDDPREYVDAKAGASRLQRLLAAKHVLIVLDDVWDYHHVAAFIVDAPRCRWLVTTRLGGLADDLGLAGEQRVALDTLSDDEALELIARRLNDPARAARDRALHLAIVQELHGHTQAVAIAAARLAAKGKKGLAAAELLRRYRQPRPGENPLSVLKLEDEGKELNLEKSLGESYAMLDEVGQRRFRQLGVFAPEGTFVLAAAAAVWETDESAAEEALRELVDLALLSAAGEGRFGQHALLRAYALALLRDAAEDEAAQGWHFGYYATEYADEERNRDCTGQDNFDRITTDLDNILYGGQWGLINSTELANRLLNAVRANRLQTLGYLELRLGSLESARAWLEEARGAYADLGDRLGEANTIKALGDVHLRLADYEAARAKYEEARPIYRAIGDRLGEANTIQALGDVHRMLADYEAARAKYEEARPMYAAIGARPGLSNVLFRLGQIAWQEGDLVGAEPLLAGAVELSNQFAPGGSVTLYFTEQLAALRAELATEANDRAADSADN